MVGNAVARYCRPAFAVCLLATLVASAPSSAETGDGEAAKRQQIREIMRLAGTMEITDQMLDSTIVQLAAVYEHLNPEEGPALVAILQNEFRDVFDERSREFEEVLVDIYDEHFTAQETADLLTFYRSPLGQRMLEELPAIVSKATLAGQEFGRQVAAEAYDRANILMRSRGYRTPN